MANGVKTQLSADAGSELYGVKFDTTANTGTTLLKVSETVKGTEGNDKATIEHIIKDANQGISMGAGDDVFVFSSTTNSSKTAAITDAVNGFVDMGLGGNDKVFLSDSIDDYIFNLRSVGSINIQFSGQTDDQGHTNDPAITFKSADVFSFRTTAADGSVERHEFSYDNLHALIATQSDLLI